MYARLNTQNAFTGLATPGLSEPMDLSVIGKQIQIQTNTRKSRPSSATLYTPVAPQSAASVRPQSATFLPLQSEQAHRGQLKIMHSNLQRQQGSRSLLKTRRRKHRKSRKARRNRRNTR
jgi:hypothetical protein